MNPVFARATASVLVTMLMSGLAVAQTTTQGGDVRTHPAATSTASGVTVGDRSSKLDHKDKAFLKQAAQNGHAEVEASKLAAEKSTNAQVKAFAQQMVEDHTKTNTELSALAASKGVDVPADPSLFQKIKEKMLSARDGAGFDKHYVESLGVKAHEDTIKLFQKAANEAKDPDVKAFASKTLPALQHHLQAAKDLQTGLKANDKK